MTDISRLSLGTMSMSIVRNPKTSIKTIHAPLDAGITLSQLVLAWFWAKYDHVQTLIGTTKPEHLLESVDALKVALTPNEIQAIETALPAEQVKGSGMRNFVFTNGIMAAIASFFEAFIA